MINVEVAYALPDEQKVVALKMEVGSSAYDAVIRSRIVEYFPEIDPDSAPMGVFGKAIRKPKEHLLADGERVEIYRPLIIDPKTARANRAAKVKQQKQEGAEG